MLFVDPDHFSRADVSNWCTWRLATRSPTYGTREFAEAGGLMSYGPNVADAYRQVGVYTGRLLKGTSLRTYRSCN